VSLEVDAASPSLDLEAAIVKLLPHKSQAPGGPRKDDQGLSHYGQVTNHSTVQEPLLHLGSTGQRKGSLPSGIIGNVWVVFG
jgi:hypothetical protein